MFVLKDSTGSDRLEAIKAELTLVLPDVKSSHRCEAIARGLGFTTYAAALATMRSGSSDTSIVRGDRFTTYLSDHGFDVPATSLYCAAARVALRDVADRASKLTVQGISVGGPRRKPDGRWEDFREMNAKFLEARQRLIGDSAAKPFLASLAFLARVTPTKTIRTGTGSYWLKHVAENFACTYPGGEKLGPTYVPNGVLIAAALHAGFQIRTYVDDLGYDHPNVSFNMSKRSLEELDCEIRRNGTRAPARRRKPEMQDLVSGTPQDISS